MATTTTSSGLGIPTDGNLGGTPLHPTNGGNVNTKPQSMTEMPKPGNAGLNDPEPGPWSTLTPTVSDPSKWSM